MFCMSLFYFSFNFIFPYIYCIQQRICPQQMRKTKRFFSRDRRYFEKNHLQVISSKSMVLNTISMLPAFNFISPASTSPEFQIQMSNCLLASPLGSLKTISKLTCPETKSLVLCSLVLLCPAVPQLIK